jgi:hypothetical protein
MILLPFVLDGKDAAKNAKALAKKCVSWYNYVARKASATVSICDMLGVFANVRVQHPYF